MKKLRNWVSIDQFHSFRCNSLPAWLITILDTRIVAKVVVKRMATSSRRRHATRDDNEDLMNEIDDMD